MGFVESFIDQYLKDFAEAEQGTDAIFRNAFEDLCSMVDRRLEDFRCSVNSLKQFNNASKTVKELEDSLIRIEKDIHGFTMNLTETKKRFSLLEEKANEILKVFKVELNHLNDKVEELYNEIINSPKGNSHDGLPFQRVVLDFIDVVFIHEFIRDHFPKTRCKGIKMDGLYNIHASFNATERTGFAFQKVLIECKNKLPKINDLMQCFKYTLCYQTTEISKVPLVLLICRSKPGRNSSIWEINRRIFDKQVANETRIILILSMDDLADMKQLKVTGLDPAKVLRDKITEFD